MPRPQKLLFLPGAGGSPTFWHPVAELIDYAAEQRLLGWPGFGDVPERDDVKSFEDLVDMVIGEVDRPCALIAQSMGGAIALRVALARPELITHLVLTATSGGVDMSDTGAADWRPSFFAVNPTVPRWFESYRENLGPKIPAISIPSLLLWGDSDSISPVAVGSKLNGLLRDSILHVVPGGEHDLAYTHAAQIAPVITRHLRLS